MGFFIWSVTEKAAGLLFTTVFYSDENRFTSEISFAAAGHILSIKFFLNSRDEKLDGQSLNNSIGRRLGLVINGRRLRGREASRSCLRCEMLLIELGQTVNLTGKFTHLTD